MTVTRGLIIADPWIDHILNGRKDWEMRSQATSIRGWFGLIRKGSGSVVGLARLRDCGMALNQTAPSMADPIPATDGSFAVCAETVMLIVAEALALLAIPFTFIANLL